MNHYDNFINGKFVPAAGVVRTEVTNPSTGYVICTVPDSASSDVEAAISAGERAQISWAKRPAIERAQWLRKIAQKIRDNAEPIARVIVEEQGKILGLARVEVSFTADYIDYMAEWARRIEGEILDSDRPGENIFLFRQPIGVIGGILPWNFPFFLIARKAGAGAGHGQHHRHQAQRRDSAQRRQVLRDSGANGPAAGRHQCRSRPRRHGRQRVGRHRRASA